MLLRTWKSDGPIDEFAMYEVGREPAMELYSVFSCVWSTLAMV